MARCPACTQSELDPAGSCPSCGQSFPEAAGTLATRSEAATHVAPAVGRGGRDQVVRLLGRGGMGKVWQALTNLRNVPDASTSTGWKTEISPFPGWKDVPSW